MRKQQSAVLVPGVLVRGSLINLRRKCGKPICSCAEGEMHTTPALSYSVKGKTRILTLRSSDVAAVKQALLNYRRAAAELEKKAMAGIHLTTLSIMKAKRKT
jgi:hypothetical protein